MFLPENNNNKRNGREFGEVVDVYSPDIGDSFTDVHSSPNLSCVC